MQDLRPLIGVPWGEVDCWGLLRRAYRDLFSIDLPSYDGADPGDCREVARLIEAGRGDWFHVKQPEFGDALLFRQELTLPTHVAMAVDAGRMLHVRRGQHSTLDWWDDSWRGRVWRPRFAGAWRHRLRARQQV